MASEERPLLSSKKDEDESKSPAWLNPITALPNFVGRIADNFSWQFAVYLACIYIGIKGFIMTVVGVGQVPFYKDFLKLGADRYQSLKTVASTPWSLKALIGALSDSLPLFGYHKRSYIMIGSVLGFIAVIVVSLLPKEDASAQIAAAMFFLVNVAVATADLLTEGKYAEEMRNKPHTGSDLVSYAWGLVMFGTLLGSCVAGPVSEAGHPKLVFIICIPFFAQIFIPLLMGWLPEQRLPPESRHLRTEKFKKQPRLFLLGFVVAGGALILALIGEMGSTAMQFGVSVIVSVVACVLAFLWLPRVLANAIIYMFLSSVLYVQIDGATTYFFLATPEQYPNGPHFSNIYFFTYTAVVGAVAGMLGVTLFQAVLSKAKFRTAFWTTTLIQCSAAIIDVTLVKRWNVTHLGIPDSWFYMLGDAMIVGMVSMMNFMPSIVLTSKVCPKGVESLVYALLAGFQNFGGTVASYAGAFLIENSTINTKATQLPWNFDQLPMLLVICHMLLPLIAVPLTFFLIPDAKMTDEFVFDELNATDDLEEDRVEAAGARKVAPYQD